MKVAYITPSFYPAHIYGGPTMTNYDLCRYLVRTGCEVRVLTTDADGPDAVLNVETDHEIEMDDGLRVRYCRRLLSRDVSPILLGQLSAYIRWADVVHLAAVYSFPTIPTLLACKAMKKPLVWTPLGTLQRWEGSTRLGLKAAWELVCRAAMPERLILHVSSEDEAKESRERFPGIETVVIPYGVEIPAKMTHPNVSKRLRLLFLGRLDPKKGIENLLSACKLMAGEIGTQWSLTIAGAGDPNYTETIQARIEALELPQQVKMIGEVVGKAKQRLFEDSDLCILPSYTESFCMVVAEALAHGVPVIASKGMPWGQVEEIGCGLWVDNDPNSLAHAIKQMSKMSLCAMGQRGREWIQQKFSWHTTAREMRKCYELALAKQAAH